MIDQLIVFVYLMLVLFIAIVTRSKFEGFKNFTTLTPNIKNSKILLVATIFTSSVGGATCFGISEKVYSGKISYAYGLLITIIIDLLIAYFLVPKISKHYRAESVGDIMFEYYGRIGRTIAGIAAVMVSVGFVAAQISVCGLLFSYLFNIHHHLGIILSYGIIIIYTTLGGLKSIILTSLFQFLAIIITIPLLTIIGFQKIDTSIILSSSKFLLTSQHNLIPSIIAATLSYSVMNLYPYFIQRALINTNYIETQKAIYRKSMIYGIFLIFIIMNGILSYSFNPNISPHLALLNLIKEIIPTGVQGIVIIGFLAAVMSTADADLNVTSISLIKDILNPILKIEDSKKLLLLTRIINVATGSLTLIIALNFKSVIDLVIFITGFWGPIILIPFIFALYDIIISPKLLILTSFIGGSSFLTWEYYCYELPLRGVFVGTAFSFITFIVCLLNIKHSNNRPHQIPNI